MRGSPYTTPRLRRWLTPKGLFPVENETLVREWTTEDESLTFELHEVDGHDEVLLVEDYDEDEDEDDEEKVVTIATDLDSLEEIREILSEIAEVMKGRHEARLPKPPKIRLVKER